MLRKTYGKETKRQIKTHIGSGGDRKHREYDKKKEDTDTVR